LKTRLLISIFTFSYFGEKGVGPELSQMGGMHPVEFLAESIANPNAVIDAEIMEDRQATLEQFSVIASDLVEKNIRECGSSRS